MPRQQVVRTGRGTVTLVVKRIKGRLYVYDEYRANGKVQTFYVGPLEENGPGVPDIQEPW